MNNWIYFFLPLFSALTGWLVSWSLFKFIVYPRQPKRILGMTIQGVLPKLKNELPGQLAGFISNELKAATNIGQEFIDPANLQNILPLIEDHIDDFLKNKLPAEMPMIAMFVGDKTIGTLKQSFLKEMKLLFPEVMQQYALGLKTRFESTQFLQQKLGPKLDLIEEKIEQKLRGEFRSAGTISAVVGFLSGLILVAILLIIN